MTPVEFKAWFDGFTEAMNGVPTKAQWERIKTRVAEVDGRPVVHHVHQTWPMYQPGIRSPLFGQAQAIGQTANCAGSLLTDAGRAEFKAAS
jgi:hypothetical protein